MRNKYKRRRIAVLLCALGAMTSNLELGAQEVDVMSDTWVCNDGLGRPVACSDDGYTPTTPYEDTMVGIFYYLWHGQEGTEVKDVTRLLEKDPVNPAFGDYYQYHWGGKPALDYYVAGDNYIVARHMQMLMDAGVDFYFFDTTNALIYPNQVKAVLKECSRRKTLGLKWPKLCFAVHTRSNETVKLIYDTFYTQQMYKGYWLEWDGKPLILTDEGEYQTLSEDLKQFFTHRFCWAYQEGENRWPWLANSPQQYNYVTVKGKRKYEQMVVSTGQHAHTKIGKSYHNGKQPAIDKYGLCKETPYGYYFAEQMERAVTLRPRVLMITQWNEWIAMRFPVQKSWEKGYTRPGAVEKIGESYFVDVYNQEFSRDIEPSSESLIRDNYYMQMISYIRQYRGVRPIPEPTVSKVIDMDGYLEQWEEVTPEFLDEPGDVLYKSATAQPAACRKRNSNDIVLCKVTKDKGNLYFMAKVNGTKLVQPALNGTETWMNLLLNTDMDYDTGWEGYDYKVSREGRTANVWLYRFDSQSQQWVKAVDTPMAWKSDVNYIMVKVPKADVGIENECDFDFKWIDNTQAGSLEILDFVRDGECAPDTRFNYRYKGSKLPSVEGDGVERVTAKGGAIMTMDSGVLRTCGVDELVVYSQSGQNVAVLGAGESCHLAKGIYVARYSVDGEDETCKFQMP